jgi:hypothetical protein
MGRQRSIRDPHQGNPAPLRHLQDQREDRPRAAVIIDPNPHSPAISYFQSRVHSAGC